MSVLNRNLGLAFVAVFLLASCHQGPSAPSMPPPEVGVLTVQPQVIPIQQDMAGRLAAYRSADVRARVEGVIQKRLYVEGSDVKAGQPLFQIDPAPFKAALNQAQSQLQAAQATYKNAHDMANRARQLAPSQFISRSDVDQAIANERTAAATVEQLKAAVRSAEINLSYTLVTAPISGRAANQQVTEGALVGASQNRTLLTTIDQMDPLYLNFSMNAAQWSAIQTAQSSGQLSGKQTHPGQVHLLLDNNTVYPHPGLLDFSGATADPATGTVTLRAIVPNPDHQLLPGLFVHFRAVFGQRDHVFVVPSSAVLWSTNNTYVFCVTADETVQRRQIQTNNQLDSQWIVTDGLKSGDRIIVDGVQKVQDGQRVHSTPWQAQGANPNALTAPKASTAQKDE